VRKFVTVSYQYGTITVPQYSRIKINLKSGRMVDGFFVREIDNNFVVIIPRNLTFFQKGIVKGF